MDSLARAAEALVAGSRQPIGWFKYVKATDQWTWSDTLLAIHGFRPGQVVPTPELLLAHKHPDDRVHMSKVRDAVLAAGQPYCSRHRIVDAQDNVRIVVSIGIGDCGPGGEVEAVRGYFIDITDASAGARREEISAAVNASAATRAVIEQAKGALMLAEGLTANDAFDLLAAHSAVANIKLRDVAQAIIDELSAPRQNAETPNQRVARLLRFVVVGGSPDPGPVLEAI